MSYWNPIPVNNMIFHENNVIILVFILNYLVFNDTEKIFASILSKSLKERDRKKIRQG